MITKQMKDMTPSERSEYMKSLRSKVKKPGFKSMDKDKQKAIAKLGGRARHKKEDNGLEQSKD